MIDRLRFFFKNPAAVLVTCGFSFGDQHLNEVLLQGLQGNPTSAVFALLYGNIGSYPHLARLAANRINLNVLAKDAAMIGSRTAPWTKGRDAVSCSDSTAIKWEVDPANAALKDARFVLGDFASLGSFVKELIGDNP